MSPSARTLVSEVIGGEVREREVGPEDFGLRLTERGAIAGGTAAENAAAIERILSGDEHPAREAVILNAAAGLAVAGADVPLPPRHRAEQARDAITSGAARERLEIWRNATAKRKEGR